MLTTVFTVISGLTGLLGLWIAVLAKRDSKRANDIAERSDKLAAESNTLASESNSIAVDARKLAEEANTISLRSEQRDTEINDVSWNYDWINPGSCKITNTGSDEAFGVTVRLAVDGNHVHSARRDIPAGDHVVLFHQALADELARRREEFRTEQRAFTARVASEGASATYEMPPMKWPVQARLEINIHWSTKLGKQREKSFEDLDAKFHF